MDELGKAFEELSNNYDFLKNKYLKMKKKNELLQYKLIVISKEKFLSSILEKTEMDFNIHKISCKAKFPIIDENEIFTLKNKIDIISNVFKKCEFDKARLKATFSKRQTQRKHHTHTIMLTLHHNHKHNMYGMLHMFIKHTQMHMLIMLTHIMHSYMPRCIYAPIVAAKVIWLSSVMIN